MQQSSKRVVPAMPGAYSQPPAPPPLLFSHGFSEDGLHRGLLIVLLALAALATVEALNTRVAVWLLEPVLVQVPAGR